MSQTATDASGSVLIVGASRGLGLAMAATFAGKGWNVVGTVRETAARTQLHDLADANNGRIAIESVDINEPDQIAALHQRLSGRQFDILFVNAGTSTVTEAKPYLRGLPLRTRSEPGNTG